MKLNIVVFILVCLTQLSFSQAVKDRNVISIGVTLNQVLRLTVDNTNVNFEFDNFSVSLGINGSQPSNNNNHSTNISVQSSTRWTLFYGAEESVLSGINNPQNILELNNVGFGIINNGLHEFSKELLSVPTNNGNEISALQIFPIALIEDNNGNGGDDKDNNFTIDWRCGTAEGNMNQTKLLDMSPAPDKYYVNVIFELKAK